MKTEGAFIVTGGGSGLGFATAKLALLESFDVAIIGRDKNKLLSARDALLKNNPSKKNVTIHDGDISDPRVASEITDEIVQEHSKIQVLINNAGTWISRKKTEDVRYDEVLHAMNLNFFPTFNMTSACLRKRHLLRSEAFSIVNIGATASLRSAKQTFLFSLGKSGMRAYSQSLAKELSAEKVHVSHLVIDGMIDNDRTRKLNENLDENRFMQAESIAKRILDMVNEDPSCWTFEADIRPFTADW